MQQFFSVIFIFLSISYSVQGAYLINVPQVVTQPDGTEIRCFASGDEFHHWLHDSLGYTIILNPQTAYFTYAEIIDDQLTPTAHVVDNQSFNLDSHYLSTMGIQPFVNISSEAWEAKRKAGYVQSQPLRTNKNKGILNNIVIFIRFSDDSEFTTNIDRYEQLFNDENANANSMRHYFKDISYAKLDIETFFYPQTQSNSTVLSYQDTHSRDYYRPLSAANPQGYSGDEQKKSRAQNLLRNAVLAVRDDIPSDLNVDFNDDGQVDNLCFIVKGEPEGWSELLWPQKLNFDDAHYVSINGKKCYTYNFQLENYALSNVGVLCHEMFHSLGAPDLYHYNNIGSPLYPVGKWDVMEITTEPPQSTGAYMKYKYGNWIDSIPAITQTGFYELNPLHSGEENVCYKIAVPESDQEYLLVEYREKTGVFEGSLPSSGLLIYRIWPHVNGNEYPNGDTVFDEVYIYRPGGGYSEKHEQAAFSTQLLHSNFHKNITDPACVLTNKSYGSIGIHYISITENNTMRFYVVFDEDPVLFTKEESVLFSSSSGNSKTIDVYTNLDSWTISSEASWLSVNQDIENKQITISTNTANPNTYNRTARVYLNGGEGLQQIISVTQSLGNATLTVTPKTQIVTGESGSSAEYSVSTTYTDWDASTTANWVEIATDSDNNILMATAKTANDQSTDRQAIIKVVSGNAQVNAFFIQSQQGQASVTTVENDKFHISPNPVKDQLSIITYFPVKEINIIDVQGKIIWNNRENQKNHHSIDFSSFLPGVYFVKLYINNKAYTQKIIKEQ
jgi:M6 family metalloprotease-like protein